MSSPEGAPEETIPRPSCAVAAPWPHVPVSPATKSLSPFLALVPVSLRGKSLGRGLGRATSPAGAEAASGHTLSTVSIASPIHR